MGARSQALYTLDATYDRRYLRKMKSVSIVVPTRDRPAFLRRLFRYYADTSCTLPIIVADSSERPGAQEENERIVSSARAEGLTVARESFDPSTRMYTKLGRALSRVQTPYVALCGDDDVLMEDALAHGATFLDSHQDYALVHGRSANATVGGGGITVVDFLQRSVEGERPRDRLAEHLAHFSATLYSLHRIESLRGACAKAGSALEEWHPQFRYRLCELLASCLTLIDGKMKKLDMLYMIRQGHHDPHSVRAQTIQWPDFFTHDDFSSHYKNFRACLARALVEREGGSSAEAERIVDQAFRSYMRGQLTREHRLMGRIRFNIQNQWVRVLQEPHSLSERLLLEIRTPLWSLQRSLSPVRRKSRRAMDLLRHYPGGIAL